MIFILYAISTLVIGFGGASAVYYQQYPLVYMMFCWLLFSLATYIKEKE